MNAAEQGIREDLKEVGPWGQSVALAFRFLFIAVCCIAAGWFVSNVRQIPPDGQAVVMRLGTVARVQGSGLLVAFPRPIEQVVVVPAAARQVALPIARFSQGQDAGASADRGYDLARDPRLNSGFLLTGDSNVVHLDAQIFYQVADAAAYMVSADHVRPALQRLFIASAIRILGRRDLDSILVARPEIAAQPAEAARRERLRADILAEVNRRLTVLAAQGVGLGVMASRIDLVPSIPAMAKSGFDNVLTVTQSAETTIANAQTAAQFTAQDANSKKDKIATSATATATELVTNARAQTASIAAMSEQSRDMSRSMQMTRLYADRVRAILAKAGGIDVVDKEGARLMLPGVAAAKSKGN
ncbi:MAG TPA: SPFH domain-containing protein [Rhizomicrobium sp.]|nr:SPFH domain-containing protein [Rhizomicrobium sp.]